AEIELHDQAVEAVVGDQQIAAAAEEEQREIVIGAPGDRLPQLVDGRRAEKTARGAADADGGEGGERDVGLDLHARKAIPPCWPATIQDLYQSGRFPMVM